MAPDSIDADPKSLPRSFRGYNRRATEELFRRVAWDYAVLAGEHRKLKQSAEAAPVPAAPPVRQRADFDEEAHSLLAAAQRAARDLRESTRVECEQALKKARGRAAEIEAEADRAAAVVGAASALRASFREALRRFDEQGDPVASAALDPVES